MISLGAKVIGVVVSVAALSAGSGGAYYYWTGTPMYSLQQLHAAVQIQDQNAIERYVDKDSVVDSLVDPFVDTALSEYMGEISTQVTTNNDTWGLLGVGIAQGVATSIAPSLKSKLKIKLIEGFDERLQDKDSLNPSHFKLEQNGSSAKICLDNTQKIFNLPQLKLICFDMAQNTDRSWTIKRFSDVTVNKAKTEIKKLVIEQAGEQYAQYQARQNQPQVIKSAVQPPEQLVDQPPLQSIEYPQTPQPVAQTTTTGWGTLHSNDSRINLRTGPGTINKAIGYGINGDRVQVLDSGQDRGGYYWYKVSFPKSGAVGWVAAQLLDIDQ